MLDVVPIKIETKIYFSDPVPRCFKSFILSSSIKVKDIGIPGHIWVEDNMG